MSSKFTLRKVINYLEDLPGEVSYIQFQAHYGGSIEILSFDREGRLLGPVQGVLPFSDEMGDYEKTIQS
jgi:hypothetical protein